MSGLVLPPPSPQSVTFPSAQLVTFPSAQLVTFPSAQLVNGTGGTFPDGLTLVQRRGHPPRGANRANGLIGASAVTILSPTAGVTRILRRFSWSGSGHVVQLYTNSPSGMDDFEFGTGCVFTSNGEVRGTVELDCQLVAEEGVFGIAQAASVKFLLWYDNL